MEYRLLGNSGLKVSLISFGNWLNSNDPNNQQRTNDLIQKCFSMGINYFDTSESYGHGEAERQLGTALKSLNANRQDLVVSTKIFWGSPDSKVNTIGTSRKHVLEGLNNSLKRLQLDYVDVLFCHRFDHETPVEETCRAFDNVIRSGKVHYWGTSEWSAANIFEAFMICERFNLIKPIVEQPQYNMLIREKMEKDFIRLFDIYKYGSTVWSPLAGGVLTGKYNEGVPQDKCRFVTFQENPVIQRQMQRCFGEQNKDQYIEMLKGLGVIAKEMGCSQSQLAMAWVIKNKDVSTAITSATSSEQLDDIIKSVDVYKKITPEIECKINLLTKSSPVCDTNFITFKPFEPRR